MYFLIVIKKNLLFFIFHFHFLFSIFFFFFCFSLKLSKRRKDTRWYENIYNAARCLKSCAGGARLDWKSHFFCFLFLCWQISCVEIIRSKMRAFFFFAILPSLPPSSSKQQTGCNLTLYFKKKKKLVLSLSVLFIFHFSFSFASELYFLLLLKRGVFWYKQKKKKNKNTDNWDKVKQSRGKNIQKKKKRKKKKGKIHIGRFSRNQRK